MSAYFRQIGVGMTVHDGYHLPDGMDDDDVVNEVREVIGKAIAEWFAKRGHEFLRCEPTVG